MLCHFILLPMTLHKRQQAIYHVTFFHFHFLYEKGYSPEENENDENECNNTASSVSGIGEI